MTLFDGYSWRLPGDPANAMFLITTFYENQENLFDNFSRILNLPITKSNYESSPSLIKTFQLHFTSTSPHKSLPEQERKNLITKKHKQENNFSEFFYFFIFHNFDDIHLKSKKTITMWWKTSKCRKATDVKIMSLSQNLRTKKCNKLCLNKKKSHVIYSHHTILFYLNI